MWGELVVDSLIRPRAAARRVLALGVPLAELLQAALLVTCAGTVLLYAAFRLLASPADADLARLLHSPLVSALLQLGELAVIVMLVARVGRLFGGTGSNLGAFALVLWFNVMTLLLLSLLIVSFLVVPPLAVLLALAVLLWMFWAPANFIAELHGFQNAIIVLGGVVLSTIVLYVVINLVINILLAMLGLTPQEAT